MNFRIVMAFINTNNIISFIINIDLRDDVRVNIIITFKEFTGVNNAFLVTLPSQMLQLTH